MLAVGDRAEPQRACHRFQGSTPFTMPCMPALYRCVEQSFEEVRTGVRMMAIFFKANVKHRKVGIEVSIRTVLCVIIKAMTRH